MFKFLCFFKSTIMHPSDIIRRSLDLAFQQCPSTAERTTQRHSAQPPWANGLSKIKRLPSTRSLAAQGLVPTFET